MKDSHDRPTGLKFDQDKPRWDLVPYEALSSVVDVLTHGSKKYGDHNWRLVDNWEDRYVSAAMRDLVSYQTGDVFDDETHLPHLAHAACCILFLLAKEIEEG